MDSSHRHTTWRSCVLPLPRHHNHHHQHEHHHNHPHNHHHHHHISPHCPFHSYLLQPNTSPQTCTNFTFPQNPQPSAKSIPSPTQFNLQLPDALIVQEENEELDAEDEDEEEPVFVLTDEWREFFAKSEAKRRLEKKQARKKGKN